MARLPQHFHIDSPISFNHFLYTSTSPAHPHNHHILQLQHNMSLRSISIGLLLALSSTVVHARSGGYAATCQYPALAFSHEGIFLDAECGDGRGGYPFAQLRVGSSFLLDSGTSLSSIHFSSATVSVTSMEISSISLGQYRLDDVMC